MLTELNQSPTANLCDASHPPTYREATPATRSRGPALTRCGIAICVVAEAGFAV